MEHHFTYYIILMLSIALLVMLAQRIRISYPVVVVVGGLAISFIPGLPVIQIDPELIFLIFLPPLLYEAAWNTSWKEFWRFRRIIGSFAFLIVLFTAGVIAVVSNAIIPGFSLALGFLLGGIVSPPDAVSATTIMNQVKVPKGLLAIVEGESLLNDAASITIFRFAIVAVQTGEFVFGKAAGQFGLVIVMGIVVGLAIALIYYAIHRWLPTTPSIDIILTLTTPYVMYIVAERFHFSGVLAVVSGGLFLSNHNRHFLSRRSRLQGVSVWSALGFLLNGLVFILIGLSLPVIIKGLGEVSLMAAVKYGLIISLTLIVVRLLCALGASAFTVFASRFVKTANAHPGWRGPVVFGWAGMRGVVSLAAALSIPVYINDKIPFPQRNLILFITFMVIVVTLVLQGLTLPWLIRNIRLEKEQQDIPVEVQSRKIQTRMKMVALEMLEKKYGGIVEHNDLLKGLKKKMQYDYAVLKQEPDTKTKLDAEGRLKEDYKKVMLDIIHQQRLMLQKINRKEEVDESVVKHQFLELDHEEERLIQQVDPEDIE